MNNDKALQKAVSKDKNTGLSYGFDQRVMHAVFQQAEKQAQRKFAWSLVLVSMVSLVIILAAVYVLHSFYAFNVSLSIPHFNYSAESKSIFIFSLYISAIVLFLLGIDSYFRRLKKRAE